MKSIYIDESGGRDQGDETTGRCPDAPCLKFYKAASHPEWKP